MWLPSKMFPVVLPILKPICGNKIAAAVCGLFSSTPLTFCLEKKKKSKNKKQTKTNSQGTFRYDWSYHVSEQMQDFDASF